MKNRQWILVKRPKGHMGDDLLEWRTVEVPPLGEGECLVKNLQLSLDPTQRIWMTDIPQYLPPVALGDVMRGGTIGRVVASEGGSYAVGDYVQGFGQWQDYWIAKQGEGSRFRPQPGAPLSIYFGLLGATGFTAYFGMLEIGKPRACDTVVVSAAAGAVGSVAGQIAKIAGARVIGIAGGAEKCEWITKDLGFDAAIDYKSEPVAKRLKELAPKGVDVYFDNTGGEILDAVLLNLALGARIPLCGLISGYDSGEPARGPKYYANILMQRATVQGFIVLDYAPRFAEAAPKLAAWHAEGKLKYRVDVEHGLENAPRALKKLFDGSNRGKLIVEIAQDA
jgi:hypothetical protein